MIYFFNECLTRRLFQFSLLFLIRFLVTFNNFTMFNDTRQEERRGEEFDTLLGNNRNRISV